MRAQLLQYHSSLSFKGLKKKQFSLSVCVRFYSSTREKKKVVLTLTCHIIKWKRKNQLKFLGKGTSLCIDAKQLILHFGRNLTAQRHPFLIVHFFVIITGRHCHGFMKFVLWKLPEDWDVQQLIIAPNKWLSFIKICLSTITHHWYSNV